MSIMSIECLQIGCHVEHIFIYIYIYIYGLKNTHNLLKITNISLLFRSFVNVKTNFKQKYR